MVGKNIRQYTTKDFGNKTSYNVITSKPLNKTKRIRNRAISFLPVGPFVSSFSRPKSNKNSHNGRHLVTKETV